MSNWSNTPFLDECNANYRARVAREEAEQAAHKRALERIAELEAAGDVLAHCLTFKYYESELAAWWKLRGGNCTVCNYDEHPAPPR